MQFTEYVYVSVTAPAPTPQAAPAKGRDRYLDTLRAIAIFRVVFYHGFAFSWLPWIPAMGIMFALAGSLMVRSIDKSPKQAVISRFRRLLPVVWAFGLIWIPLMIWHDGSPSTWTGEGTTPIPVWQNVFWFLPAGDPPGSHWGEISWGVLWYLKTYLWFVALSPVLLWAFRKKPWMPWAVMVLPFLAMLAADQGFIPSDGWYGSTLYDTLTYLGCWIIGFAHGTGLLKRIPLALLFAIGATVAGLGIWYLSGPGNAQAIADGAKPWVVENSNFALSLYSFGIVFILMRFSSRMEWLKKHPIIDRVITIMNARAVTIYLWHNTALTLASMAADHFAIYPWYFWFPLTWVLIFGFVLGFGWVEDFAARRKPELLPGKKKPDPAAAAEAAAAPGQPGQQSAPEQTAIGGWAPVSPVNGYRGEPQYQDARYGDGRYQGDRYDDRRYRDDQYDDRRYQDAQYGDAHYRDAPRQGGHYPADPYQGQTSRDYPRRDHDPRERYERGTRYPAQEYGGSRDPRQGQRFPSQQYGTPRPRQPEPDNYPPPGIYGRPRPQPASSDADPRYRDGNPDPDDYADRGRRPYPR